uniref:Uncharacterized protein n=1 Tax=Marseillevirus LCMAC102 TaxID=2506603 RepID=A0A481YTT8_9VIRU|nr:MAG: hypothetical protein LCMAC102_01420 [Marseillevirus LCMAC102]
MEFFDTIQKAQKIIAKQEYEIGDVFIYCEKLNVPHMIGIDNENIIK